MTKWTLEDVQRLKGLDLVKFLLSKGILKEPSTCPGCGKEGMRVEYSEGGEGRFRCRGRKCRRSVGLREGSVFEGTRISLEKMMLLVLFWANGVPFVSIERLLDVDHKTEESFRMGLAMRMQGEVEKLRVGGPGLIVEVDEMEFGRKKKGQFGKEADPKIFIWGCVCRETGGMVLVPYQKLDREGCGNRFGPSSKDEVLPFVEKFVVKGSRVFSDGLRAYRDNLVGMGYPGSECVSHKEGEYVKEVSGGVLCHTNTIDGMWGHVKGHLRFHHFPSPAWMEIAVYELGWRKNFCNDDAFEAFLDLCSR